jgi:hypothetical protein
MNPGKSLQVINYFWDQVPHVGSREKDLSMVRGRKTSLAIQLTPEERSVLESWQESTGIPEGMARRGRIILMLEEGTSISQISRTIGIRRRFIYKWVYRFLDQRICGLTAKPGRNQTIPPRESAVLESDRTLTTQRSAKGEG